jgi:dCTP deaminase
MILTDREIRIAIARGLIEIDPPPNEAVAFTSTAVDLTLDPIIRTFKEHAPGVVTVIDPTASGFNSETTIRELTDEKKIPSTGYQLGPKKLVLAWTREYIRLAIETRTAARVEGRSSLARLGLGVHVTAPTIHAGFAGPIQLEMINHGIVPILLRPGMRICQLIFETTLGTPEKGYLGQFLNQPKTGKRKSKSS